MKKLAISLIVLAALFFIVPPFLPTSVGHFLYAEGTDLEASLLGFKPNETDIGEMVISYYSNGKPSSDKETVIMLHGYSADKDVWPRYAQHFNDDYHVLLPDMAGHGETGFDNNWNYGGPAQAARVIKIMDNLGIEKAHVLGNSMGGFIAAHFALRYPERTHTATLIDPAGVKSPEPSDMELMLKEGRNPFEVNSHEEFIEFYGMTMAKPPWFPQIALAAVAEIYQERRPELSRIKEDIFAKDMLDESLKDIKVPTLILWGEADQLIHVSSADVWKQGIATSEVKIWPNIGHMPMLEIPKESAQVTLAFMEKH